MGDWLGFSMKSSVRFVLETVVRDAAQRLRRGEMVVIPAPSWKSARSARQNASIEL